MKNGVDVVDVDKLKQTNRDNSLTRPEAEMDFCGCLVSDHDIDFKIGLPEKYEWAQIAKKYKSLQFPDIPRC